MAWQNKVVVVTGSTSGIGQAAALLFFRGGAKTVIHGRSSDRLKQTLELFKKEKTPSSNLHHFLGPIEQEETQKKLLEETVKKFGQIDVLVGNAGAFSLKDHPTNSVETLDYLWKINFRSNFTLAKLARPYLEKTKGSIVFVASIASKVCEPQMAPYQSTKAALDQFIRNMSIACANQGIRVNGVSPGLLIHTNLLTDFGIPYEKMPRVYRNYVKDKIPMGRMGDPMEVANVIEFLASDDASFCTGSLFTVDGGMCAGLPMKNSFGTSI